MTKTYPIAALCCFFFSSAFSQLRFTVNGRLSGLEEHAKVFLTYEENGRYVMDSAITENGAFLFSGSIIAPTKASLEVKTPDPGANGGRWNGQAFFLEKAAISVKGTDVMNASISGGKIQDDYRKLITKLQPLLDQQTGVTMELIRLMNNTDTTGRNTLIDRSRSVSVQIGAVTDDFIREHPRSFVSLYLLHERDTDIQPDTFGPLFDGLSASLKKTGMGTKLEALLRIARKTSAGQPFKDFTLPTLQGNNFSSASLRGKYVLVDFWASWCSPCRAENPMVLKIYDTFKSRNFEIVAISLDNKKEAWERAVEEDHLPWIHVSDLTGFNNKVAVEYGIRAIPRNFLVGPDGIIVAKNLDAESLEKTLEALLKAPVAGTLQDGPKLNRDVITGKAALPGVEGAMIRNLLQAIYGRITAALTPA